MSLSLSSVKPAKGSTKKRKRVGRGNASGHGTYSTRGLKGQKSRAGVSGLKRLGMKQTLLRTPKKRGFTSLRDKHQVVNVGELNKYFKDGDTINPRTLCSKGLVDNIKVEIKILGQGELKIKNLNFEKVRLSGSAKEQAEKLGSKDDSEKRVSSLKRRVKKKLKYVR